MSYNSPFDFEPHSRMRTASNAHSETQIELATKTNRDADPASPPRHKARQCELPVISRLSSPSPRRSESFDSNTGRRLDPILRDIDLKLVLHLITVPLIIIAVLALGFMLVYLKDILVPFVVAFFFVQLLRPLVKILTVPVRCNFNFLASVTEEIRYRENIYKKKHEKKKAKKADDQSIEKKSLLNSCKITVAHSAKTDAREPPMRTCQCPHWVAVIFSLVIVAFVITGLVVSIASTLRNLQYMRPTDIEENLLEALKPFFEWVKENFDIDGVAILNQFIAEIPAAELVKYLLNTFLATIMDTILVLLIVLYLLFESDSAEHEPAGAFKSKIDSQIQQYIGLKTLISAIVGIAVFVILKLLIRMEYAHLIGILTFFLNFIPNLGALIAIVITPFMMIIDGGDYDTADVILSISLPTLVHTIVGNLVEPAMFGKSLELHPVIVLISLAFWYMIWDVTGAILAVPLTAVMRICVTETNHPYAKFVQNILEGKFSKWMIVFASNERQTDHEV